MDKNKQIKKKKKERKHPMPVFAGFCDFSPQTGFIQSFPWTGSKGVCV